MSYLDDFYDPDAEPALYWDHDRIAEEEVARLSQLTQVAAAAATIPRRLDGANIQTLALDKKRCRKLAHLTKAMCRAWMTELGRWGEPPSVSMLDKEAFAEIRSKAATLNTDEGLKEMYEALDDRASLVITWAVKSGEKKFANRAANRYVTEMDRLIQIRGTK